MQNFDELKNIWQQADQKDLPSVKEILSEVAKSRKKMMRKNIFGALILSFTFAYIAWIGIHYNFQYITTKIGVVITLISILTGIFFNTKLAKMLLKQSNPTLDNSSYLQQLKEYRNQQRTIQTKGITLYFILLTLGIVLYMYEFAARDVIFGIISYSITLTWIAFNWFYLRKRTINKQQKEINTQIENIEKLINHINN
ncbi:MAG: hypothetical protein ACXVP4_10955 [Bacteroidia bacterium]